MERCSWAGSDPENRRYHDEEWGRPVTDDNRLYEKLCLEGFQSGLSWITILKKRPQFRKRFKNFDIRKVARMTDDDVEELLLDAGIVRHRGKIVSTINNARRAQDIQKEFGSLAAYIWSFEPAPEATPTSGTMLPAQTAASAALSKDLRKRGWSFVGPTTVYAFMQAMGLVNDHYSHCYCRAECEGVTAPPGRRSHHPITGGPSNCCGGPSVRGRHRAADNSGRAASRASFRAIAKEWLKPAGRRRCARGARSTGRSWKKCSKQKTFVHAGRIGGRLPELELDRFACGNRCERRSQ